MNGLQRVGSLLTGEPLDRTPVAPVLSLYGAGLTDCLLVDYYTNPECYLAGQRAVWKAIRPDVIFSPFAMALFGEAFGGTMRWLSSEAPILAEPALDKGDISDVVFPDIGSSPSLQYMLKSIEMLSDNFREEVPVAVPAPGPFDVPIMILGLERWLDCVLFERDGLQHLLYGVKKFFLDYAAACQEAGAGCLVLASPFFSADIVTPELIANRIAPVCKTIFADVRIPCLIHHTGACFGKGLGSLGNLREEIAGIVIDAKDDPHEALRAMGKGKVIGFGPDSHKLARMTPDECKAACFECLKKLPVDQRLLVSSGPDVQPETPPEVIRAMILAAEEAGAG